MCAIPKQITCTIVQSATPIGPICFITLLQLAAALAELPGLVERSFIQLLTGLPTNCLNGDVKRASSTLSLLWSSEIAMQWCTTRNGARHGYEVLLRVIDSATDRSTRTCKLHCVERDAIKPHQRLSASLEGSEELYNGTLSSLLTVSDILRGTMPRSLRTCLEASDGRVKAGCYW